MSHFWNEFDVIKPICIKDPNAILDYPIDWSVWLSGIDATYSSHLVISTGSIVIDSSSHLNGVVTVIISGGTVGETASFTIRMTATVAGGGTRVDDRTFYLEIAER